MADFNVPENPELNLLLRMLQTTDRGHADVFNVLFGQLIQNDAFLDALAKKMIEKTMITHVLDSVNINSVLGADQGAVITALIDKERDRITKLNSDMNEAKLRIGNTHISSNADGTFQLAHNADMTNYIMLARFGGNTANYITFGGTIDANNAYGVVRDANGKGFAFSGGIFWISIGFPPAI